MGQTQQKNKVLVLEAFDTLFNKRDYARSEQLWSTDYIQHRVHGSRPVATVSLR